MKIFHSFDTQLKQQQIAKYSERFGADNILVLSTSSLFLFVFVRLPLFMTILVNAGILYGIYYFSEQSRARTIYAGIPITIIFMFVIIFRGILKAYIDYAMDFCIITPLKIEKFDQTGILERNTNSMSASKIKTVNVNKKGLLYSMFDNGDIIFMSEGDLNGEIKLKYIKDPEIAKRKIISILKHSFTTPGHD